MLFAPPDAVIAAALVALVTDALFGEPPWLYRRVPHPVTLLGRVIERLEARWWRADDGPAARRRAGRRLVAATVGGAALVSLCLLPLLFLGPAGWFVAGLLASTLIAQRSLSQHVSDVAAGLETSLEGGRRAVARIVGRDPQALDGAGVARAAVESAAENLSDGVTAPLFWWLLLGPVGLVAYKAVNTLDSMIGYRSDRYLDFGRTAARLDDAANWLPARLTGIALLLVTGRVRRLGSLAREARKHRSPNAGWPEAATAFALDAKLAGPRIYPQGVVDDEWIGEGRADLDPSDVQRAVRLIWRFWRSIVAVLAVTLVLSV